MLFSCALHLICILLGFVFSGMGPDFRVLVRNARKAAQKYYLTYREIQPVSEVVRESALVMQEYTQSGGVRPFGVSCLAAGFDEDGPQLFQIDPSGAAFGWKATAIGKNYINAKNFLERRYAEDMELDDAVHIGLLTMRESFEGEMTEFNIEVAIVGSDKVFRILTPSEVRDYLDEAN
jgi:20S proteasome subunit alpha 2